MAYTPFVSEDPLKRRLQITSSGYSAVRAWSVNGASEFDALSRLANDPNGAAYGSVWRDVQGGTPLPALTCRKIDQDAVSQLPIAGGMGQWEFTANYSTEPDSQAANTPTIGGPAVYRWNIGVTKEQVDWALSGMFDNGNPIAPDLPNNFVSIRNSANQIFAGGVSADFPVITVDIQSYVTSIDVSYYLQFIRRTNSQAFLGAAPGQCYCSGIYPEASQPGWWILHRAFEFREDGFRTRITDQDDQGQRLDGHGAPLAAGSPAVWLYYTHYRTANFNDLGV